MIEGKHKHKRGRTYSSESILLLRDRDRIRTYDRLLRRQMLYPAELRDRKIRLQINNLQGFTRRDWDSNPGNTFALTD